VLHIASHFVFKPGTEKDSFLLLGDGDRLTPDQNRPYAHPYYRAPFILMGNWR